MSKIVMIANTDWFMFNFNKNLIVKLLNEGHAISVITPHGPYSDQLKDLGASIRNIEMQRGFEHPRDLINNLKRISSYIKEIRPDIVVAFTVKAVLYLLIIDWLQGQTKKVFVLTGLGRLFLEEKLRYKLLRSIFIMLLKRAITHSNNKLVVLNNGDQAEISKLLNVSKTVVKQMNGHGVDISKFSRKKLVSDPSRPLKVLMPSRIKFEKGIIEFLEAARTVHTVQPETFEFYICGEFDLASSVMSEDEWLQKCNEYQVRWMGASHDMNSVYEYVDIVVLPSYREGLPTVLLEAGLKGLSCIASNVNGCKDIITNDIDGLLVEARNPAALSQAVIRLADVGERNRFSRNLHHKVVSKFTIEPVFDEFKRILDIKY